VTWLAIGLVVALVSGVVRLPFVLAFAPWRCRRVASRLMRLSPRYERYVQRLVLRRTIRSFRRLERTLGELLLPAVQRAAAAFASFAQAQT
jgi:hypothetical protein